MRQWGTLGKVATCRHREQQDTYQPERSQAKDTCLSMDYPWQAGEDEDDRRTHGCRDHYEIKHVVNLLAPTSANWVGTSSNAESM